MYNEFDCGVKCCSPLFGRTTPWQCISSKHGGTSASPTLRLLTTWLWITEWLTSCGSLTPISSTTRSPLCMASQWRTGWSVSTLMERCCMDSGKTFMCHSCAFMNCFYCQMIWLDHKKRKKIKKIREDISAFTNSTQSSQAALFHTHWGIITRPPMVPLSEMINKVEKKRQHGGQARQVCQQQGISK